MIVIDHVDLRPDVEEKKQLVLRRLRTAHVIVEVTSVEELASVLDRAEASVRRVGLHGLQRLFLFQGPHQRMQGLLMERLLPKASLVVMPQPDAWVIWFRRIIPLTRLAAARGWR